MNKRYNVYYLFLEDKKLHKVPAEIKEKKLKNLQDFFKKIKPP